MSRSLTLVVLLVACAQDSSFTAIKIFCRFVGGFLALSFCGAGPLPLAAVFSSPSTASAASTSAVVRSARRLGAGPKRRVQRELLWSSAFVRIVARARQAVEARR